MWTTFDNLYRLLQKVQEEITKTVSDPVVAIEGITIENIDTLQGTVGVTVESAIMKAIDSYLMAQNF